MIQVSNPLVFQTAVRAISNFISEGNFRFNEKGISFKAIDQSQVVLVDYLAPKKFFKKFEVEPALAGLNIEELTKVLKRRLQGDELFFFLSDNKLEIEFKGEMTRRFSMPLIDVSEEETSIPEQEFDAKIELKALYFQELLKDAKLFGSSVVFRLNKEKLLLESSGANGSMKSVVKTNSIKNKSKKEVVSKYSLNFLENVVREANPEEPIIIELKNEAPMKTTYKIGETSIQFYLAHMIL